MLGNGVFVTRGAAEESQADGVHYPGTYVAGGYNRLVTEIGGRPIVNEDLVNFPNWLPLTFRPEGGAWFAPDAGELLSYRQVLDMREGVLTRELRVRDDAGRETRVRSRRIVHMEQPNLAAIEYSITPENWAGRVEVRSLLDGSVVNAGVPRYRDLASKHLEIVDMGAEGSGVWLLVRSRAVAPRGRPLGAHPGLARHQGGRRRAAPRGGARAHRHGAELRRRAGRDGRRREDGGALHVAGPGHQRGGPRGPGGPRARRALRGAPALARARMEGALAPLRHPARARRPTSRSSCACTSSTCSRPPASTRSAATSASRPGAGTGRPTAGTSSGTSCSCSRSSTSASR